MANPARGEVAVTVDGRTYTLVLNIDALAQLEDLLSTPARPVFFPEILARIDAGSMGATRALIWAALRTHHREMTLVQAGEVIEGLIAAEGGLTHLKDSITGLVRSTKPKPKDLPPEGEARPQAAQARKR